MSSVIDPLPQPTRHPHRVLWGLFLLLAAGIILALCVIHYRRPPVPPPQREATATAKVRIRPATRQQAWVWGDRVDPWVFKQTMCDQLTSRPTMEAALQDRDVAGTEIARMPDAADWLARQVHYDTKENSEIVNVTVTTDDPVAAALLVNAVVKAFARKAGDDDRGHKEELLAEYDRIRQENERQVEVKLARVHAQRRLGLGGVDFPDIQRQVDLDDFRQARQEVREVTAKLLGLQRRLEFEERRLKERQDQKTPPSKTQDVPRHLVDEELAKDAKTNDLRKRKEHYEQMIQGYANMSNASDTLVKATLRGYKEDLNQVGTQLRQREEALLPRIRAQLNARPPEPLDEANQRIDALKAEIEYYKAQEKFARDEYNKARERVQRTFDQPTAEVDKWAREVERHQEVAKHFAKEAEALRLDIKAPPRVEVVQLAAVPSR